MLPERENSDRPVPRSPSGHMGFGECEEGRAESALGRVEKVLQAFKEIAVQK